LCDLETSRMRPSRPDFGCCIKGKKNLSTSDGYMFRSSSGL